MNRSTLSNCTLLNLLSSLTVLNNIFFYSVVYQLSVYIAWGQLKPMFRHYLEESLGNMSQYYAVMAFYELIIIYPNFNSRWPLFSKLISGSIICDLIFHRKLPILQKMIMLAKWVMEWCILLMHFELTQQHTNIYCYHDCPFESVP